MVGQGQRGECPPQPRREKPPWSPGLQRRARLDRGQCCSSRPAGGRWDRPHACRARKGPSPTVPRPTAALSVRSFTHGPPGSQTVPRTCKTMRRDGGGDQAAAPPTMRHTRPHTRLPPAVVGPGSPELAVSVSGCFLETAAPSPPAPSQAPSHSLTTCFLQAPPRP